MNAVNHVLSPVTVPVEGLAWWQRGVIYQVWLRSFQDTNGDGSGDLPGLIAKLDYLTWLGVDILWLSPIYPSPLVESGYDVSDFTGVHELYGTLEDADRLIAEAHARGIKLILDFVPNHTSDAHPWFVESRSSRDNPRRNWYLWADPRPDGSPPNNWVGCFGGSAWTFDKETSQYYYHAFLPQQPDLNWRNPAVQEAMAEAIRFWLRRGVDGLRMDAVWHLLKDDQLRENPPNPDYTPDLPPDNVVFPEFTRNRPEVHDAVAVMRQVMEEFEDRLLAGEVYLEPEDLARYYGTAERPELHLPLNLQLSVQRWHAAGIADYVERYAAALPPEAWPNWAVGTHDSNRIASRAGDAQARVAAVLLLTLRGTPTLYYGDEIGMRSVNVPRGRIVDPRELLIPYIGLGRDPARTPMQWDAGGHASFTSGDPWLPLGEDFRQVNVRVQSESRDSMLALMRDLLALRRSLPALVAGSYATIRKEERLYVYRREWNGQHVGIALNFGPEAVSVELPEELARGRVAISTHRAREGAELDGTLALEGDEAAIVVG